MSERKTKNDISWEKLFERYQILDEVNKNGYFEIKSTQINEERESRLMAKFDHYVNLPKIFRDNSLSILPVSRSKYVIGKFDTHLQVQYNEVEATPIEFPNSLLNIESIDYINLYSESSVLHCAFNVGIIDELVGEKTLHTISGRMSTGSFNFNIKNTINEKVYSISVDNSQCEIDAVFESDNYFLLLEAKNYLVDDFLIRQLYYPYRLWSQKVNKKIIPILMTYSNDVFSFFIYSFKNDLVYNSLTLVEQKNYVIAPEEIQLDDVSSVFSTVKLVVEPNVPFPQANKFERVVDLLSLLVEKDLSNEEIAANYQFDIRQAQYYTDAGRYIGLIDKYKNDATDEISFRLTDEGRTILQKKHKAKTLLLISKILENKVFYQVFESAIRNGEIPLRDSICGIMSNSGLSINDTTIERRASTVRRWIEWIWSQTD